MTLNAALAQRIAELCAQKNITTEELAKQSGISKNMMASIMSQTHRMRLTTLRKLCDALEIPPDKFLDSLEFDSLS